MIDATLTIDSGHGAREVHLASYLDADAAERAAERANAWIKALRHARVDGEPMRRRFTFRGESLWWFTELYLHREQVLLEIFETLAAMTALFERDAPRTATLVSGGRAARTLAPQLAAARRVAYRGPGDESRGAVRLLRLDARAAWLHASALASRVRSRRTRAWRGADVAAFVHRAFWRTDAGDGSAEAYIGPVLKAVEERAGASAITYVSVGPRANFKARRWWDPLRPDAMQLAAPVESFAPLDRLRPSRQLFGQRHEMRRALWNSADLRERSVIDGCDCWPLIQEQLAGVALLQWPWSARVWDEADAALDALNPRAAVTYAEAGGWGRALMLASRARAIPSIGLQHGFIYRHWLNYLHEPDEMEPDPKRTSDRGFPRPTLTVVFDEYAAAHLRDAGHFPPASLVVAGSPRLDALVAAARRITDDEVARARPSRAGAADAVILVATKYSQARRALGALVDAAGRMPGVHVAIKTHPAETPDVYADVARGRAHVTVLEASAPLAPLLRACRAVVTVNSTVALDAAVLGIPALVIGLPNNLSPFVDAGIMAGAREASGGEDGIEPTLARVLHDQAFRDRLDGARRQFLERHAIRSDGGAAGRTADVILAAARRPPGKQE